MTLCVVEPEHFNPVCSRGGVGDGGCVNLFSFNINTSYIKMEVYINERSACIP